MAVYGLQSSRRFKPMHFLFLIACCWACLDTGVDAACNFAGVYHADKNNLSLDCQCENLKEYFDSLQLLVISESTPRINDQIIIMFDADGSPQPQPKYKDIHVGAQEFYADITRRTKLVITKINVTEHDSATYFCVIKGHKKGEIIRRNESYTFHFPKPQTITEVFSLTSTLLTKPISTSLSDASMLERGKSEENTGDLDSTGIIVLAVGSFVFLSILIIIIVCFVLRARRRRRALRDRHYITTEPGMGYIADSDMLTDMESYPLRCENGNSKQKSAGIISNSSAREQKSANNGSTNGLALRGSNPDNSQSLLSRSQVQVPNDLHPDRRAPLGSAEQRPLLTGQGGPSQAHIRDKSDSAEDTGGWMAERISQRGFSEPPVSQHQCTMAFQPDLRMNGCLTPKTCPVHFASLSDISEVQEPNPSFQRHAQTHHCSTPHFNVAHCNTMPNLCSVHSSMDCNNCSFNICSPAAKGDNCCPESTCTNCRTFPKKSQAIGNKTGGGTSICHQADIHNPLTKPSKSRVYGDKSGLTTNNGSKSEYSPDQKETYLRGVQQKYPANHRFSQQVPSNFTLRQMPTPLPIGTNQCILKRTRNYSEPQLSPTRTSSNQRLCRQQRNKSPRYRTKRHSSSESTPGESEDRDSCSDPNCTACMTDQDFQTDDVESFLSGSETEPGIETIPAQRTNCVRKKCNASGCRQANSNGRVHNYGRSASAPVDLTGVSADCARKTRRRRAETENSHRQRPKLGSNDASDRGKPSHNKERKTPALSSETDACCSDDSVTSSTTDNTSVSLQQTATGNSPNGHHEVEMRQNRSVNQTQPKRIASTASSYPVECVSDVTQFQCGSAPNGPKRQASIKVHTNCTDLGRRVTRTSSQHSKRENPEKGSSVRLEQLGVHQVSDSTVPNSLECSDFTDHGHNTAKKTPYSCQTTI